VNGGRGLPGSSSQGLRPWARFLGPVGPGRGWVVVLGFVGAGRGWAVAGFSRAPLGRRDLQSWNPRAFALLRPWARFLRPVGPGRDGRWSWGLLGREGWAWFLGPFGPGGAVGAGRDGRWSWGLLGPGGVGGRGVFSRPVGTQGMLTAVSQSQGLRPWAWFFGPFGPGGHERWRGVLAPRWAGRGREGWGVVFGGPLGVPMVIVW
jgi:hypothetical protein